MEKVVLDVPIVHGAIATGECFDYDYVINADDGALREGQNDVGCNAMTGHGSAEKALRMSRPTSGILQTTGNAWYL